MTIEFVVDILGITTIFKGDEGVGNALLVDANANVANATGGTQQIVQISLTDIVG